MANPNPSVFLSDREIPPVARRGLDTAAREVLASTALAKGVTQAVTAEAVPAAPGGVTLDAGATRYDYWAERPLLIQKTAGAAVELRIDGQLRDGTTGYWTLLLPADNPVTRVEKRFSRITGITPGADVTIDIQAGNVDASQGRFVSTVAGGTLTARMSRERFTLDEVLPAGGGRAGDFVEIVAAPADALLEW